MPQKKLNFCSSQSAKQCWNPFSGRHLRLVRTNSHLTLNHCCTATFWSITVEIDHTIVVSSFFSFVFWQTESKTSSSIHLWSNSSSTDINRGNSWWISVERFDYGETWIQVCFDSWICFFIVSLILTTIFPLFLPSSKRPLNAWSDLYVHYMYYATSKELLVRTQSLIWL